MQSPGRGGSALAPGAQHGGAVPSVGRRADRRTRVAAHVVGIIASLAVAVALFTRFGIDGYLSRDEAIYSYGGMQLAAHGTPPYVSIFDPKGPVATLICGAAALLADAVGRNQLLAIRAAFFACACLTVLAIYLLAARVWRSATAGVVAAVVFASFDGFARDALSGPDAKTPGVLCAVVCMWLLLRRHWFLGAFFASVAVLVWQPFGIFPVVAVLLALRCSVVTRRATPVAAGVLGAVLPVAATAVGFAAFGAFGALLRSAVLFPLSGVKRGPVTFVGRFQRIADVVSGSYHLSGLLFWAGTAAFVLLLPLLRWWRRPADPGDQSPRVGAPAPALVLAVVGGTFLFEAAYAVYDFQGYPDLYALLAYPALGLGGVAAFLVQASRNRPLRTVATVAVLVGALVLTTYSWTWFSTGPENEHRLHRQQANARILNRVLGPSGTLLALGTPQPLVLMPRRNPDPFIYLGSGVAEWKIAHTPGGFHGWTRQITREHPDVIVMRTWSGPIQQRMSTWLLSTGYQEGRLGPWQLYLTPAAKQRIHQVRSAT